MAEVDAGASNTPMLVTDLDVLNSVRQPTLPSAGHVFTVTEGFPLRNASPLEGLLSAGDVISVTLCARIGIRRLAVFFALTRRQP